MGLAGRGWVAFPGCAGGLLRYGRGNCVGLRYIAAERLGAAPCRNLGPRREIGRLPPTAHRASQTATRTSPVRPTSRPRRRHHRRAQHHWRRDAAPHRRHGFPSISRRAHASELAPSLPWPPADRECGIRPATHGFQSARRESLQPTRWGAIASNMARHSQYPASAFLRSRDTSRQPIRRLTFQSRAVRCTFFEKSIGGTRAQPFAFVDRHTTPRRSSSLQAERSTPGARFLTTARNWLRHALVRPAE